MNKNSELASFLIKHKLSKTERNAENILISFSLLIMALSLVLLFDIQANLNRKVIYNFSKEVIQKLPMQLQAKILTNAK